MTSVGLWHHSWWFKRWNSISTKLSESSDRETVRLQMRILCVISLGRLKLPNKINLEILIGSRRLLLQRRLYDRPSQEQLSTRTECIKETDEPPGGAMNELHKFSDGMFDKSHGKAGQMVKDFHLVEVLFPHDPAHNGGIYKATFYFVSVDVLRTISNSHCHLHTVETSAYPKSPTHYLVILPEHRVETDSFSHEMEILLEANIKTSLGYLKDGDGDGNSQPHKGVKASANSDVMYSFTSAQDGNPLQDDVRLCLGDDLKKAQDHSQRQAGDLP
ncbi:hypothetical protein Tco_0152912 [Tanacetum coccineum]